MIPFETTDWKSIPVTEHAGETGFATSQTIQYKLIRVRLVRYSPNYKANHWCAKGHIVFCVEGEFTSHLKDGGIHKLMQRMSYQVTDDENNPHFSSSDKGCTLFIVDGDFLKT